MSFYHNPCSGHLCLLGAKQGLVFLCEGMIHLLKFPIIITLKASCEQNCNDCVHKVKRLSESWPLGTVLLDLHICKHLGVLLLNVLLLLGNEIFATESFYVMKISGSFFTAT